NGPSANRLDLYVIGDGYQDTARQRRAFDRVATAAVASCRKSHVFREYDTYFNYWSLGLVSERNTLRVVPADSEETREEAIAAPRQTALGGRITNEPGSGRRYKISDRRHVHRILERYHPGEHDQVAVALARHDTALATAIKGQGVASIPDHSLVPTTHELGHALAGLTDEYDAPNHADEDEQVEAGATRVDGPNAIVGARALAQRDLPWEQWLDPDGSSNWSGLPVGMFPGSEGWWHPQQACRMRVSAHRQFCVVCAEALVLAIYAHVRPIDSVEPASQESTLVAATAFRVRVLRPTTHALNVSWSLEDPSGGVRALESTQADNTHSVRLDPADLSPGWHEVRCTVTDPTPWVRRERGRLEQTRTWRTRVE
ncbi:M64 family metallopeptidase, partial [Planctomycetota bacterium]|nr:M64 family metallopeptidase [Planctomycetota bacterium]